VVWGRADLAILLKTSRLLVSEVFSWNFEALSNKKGEVMRAIVLLTTLLFLLVGCQDDNDQSSSMVADYQNNVPQVDSVDTRVALFGDLHVHSKLSFDSWIFGTRATPDEAYNFAKGAELIHPAGISMQLRRPLDFLSVTDHGTYLGMFEQMNNASGPVGEHPLSIALRKAESSAERDAVFREILPRERGYIDFEDDLLDLGIVRSAWQEVLNAAERHNNPGSFTTFVGYEFTAGGQGGENLHRNVIFRNDRVPEIPFTRLDAKNNPEKLWDWMDQIREEGINSLAIPHNSNGSDGWMFEQTYKSGGPIDRQYSEQRLRNEPLVEITQVKGTSDSHPLMSPNDEWADFELMESTIGSSNPSRPQGSYVRGAYLTGMALAEKGVGNPYRFGLIGSSDTHNAAGSYREDRFWSKTGLLDATPQQRGSVPDKSGNYADVIRSYWSGSGLAGVWAESNTRDAIFDAFERKETFATSGPRMKVRFFASTETLPILMGREDLEEAYGLGITMGGDLNMSSDSVGEPNFTVQAMMDPLSAPLERLQVIKGWVEQGQRREQVFDVACASGQVNTENYRCELKSQEPDSQTCQYQDGASELSATWQDPDYDREKDVFYYVRALEVKTCRWSTWDALRAGTVPNPGVVKFLQERVWSSPIWVFGVNAHE